MSRSFASVADSERGYHERTEGQFDSAAALLTVIRLGWSCHDGEWLKHAVRKP